MDSSDSSRISSNDSDGNEELGVQPCLYEPETNTEGVILWNKRKSWVKVLIIEKKNQNKRRHNEKGLIFLCLSCQDINSDTMFLFMQKITACFHAVNTETVSMVWTCRFAQKWTGVLLNGHLPGVFLALKIPLFFVEDFPALLGPVQNMSARRVHYIRMSVPSVPVIPTIPTIRPLNFKFNVFMV